MQKDMTEQEFIQKQKELIRGYRMRELEIEEIDYKQEYFFKIKLDLYKRNLDDYEWLINNIDRRTKKGKEFLKENTEYRDLFEEHKLKLIKLYIDNIKLDSSPKYYDELFFKKKIS